MSREEDKQRISLGKRLRTCASFRCMGVRPNWDDFPDKDRETLRKAPKVCYPTSLYEDLFRSVGKETFPRNYYKLVGNKILQTELFQLLGIPHPRTRIYYGRNRAARIMRDFDFPFVAKIAVGSSQGQGVFLIRDENDLRSYLDDVRPAYVQEYVPMDRDLRIVVIAGRAVHAYWRIAQVGEFRNNVSRGGSISFENIPERALCFAEEVAERCRLDEAALDVCPHGDSYLVIEANMAYGLEGFRRANLNIYDVFSGLDEEAAL